MSARTGWKVSGHIYSKDSAPHLQGDLGQAILSHSPEDTDNDNDLSVQRSLSSKATKSSKISY